MKKNKYKIKKWVLIPIFLLICSLSLGLSFIKPVNAYVDTEDLSSRSRSLFPDYIYIENTEHSSGGGYTFYPFSNSAQYYLDQNINGVADPIISDNIVYDNFSNNHRIVANTKTWLYGLDDFYLNKNRFNPFISDNNLTFTGLEYTINGAYGSTDKLGGVLENLSLDNIKLLMEFTDFNIPISFLTNSTYSAQTNFSNLFTDPTEEYGILDLFGAFSPLIDSDLQITPYSLCGLYNFAFDLTGSGSYAPFINRLEISIDWLNTAVNSIPQEIGLNTTSFTYIYIEDYAFTPYISIPDILHYFITEVLDVSVLGSASWVYVSSMKINVDYSDYTDTTPIKNIYMSSIFSSEHFTSDYSSTGVFYGDNWYSILNGGEIGGNVDYELNLSSWLVSAVGAFMNAELFPGFAIGGIFAVMVAFPLVIWFLKLVLGG